MNAFDDAKRVTFLRSLNILDTKADPVFDSITETASTITHAPIALVSLVDADRQWFKSRVGLDVSETHRDLAFCSHAVAQSGGDMFVVNDALIDERFKHNALVLGEPHIRFYAGVPLVLKAKDGSQHKIGTLCVIDRTPRQLQDHHRVVLQALAKLTAFRLSAAPEPQACHTRPPPESRMQHKPAPRAALMLLKDDEDPMSHAAAEGVWAAFLRAQRISLPPPATPIRRPRRLGPVPVPETRDAARGYDADDSDGGGGGD